MKKQKKSKLYIPLINLNKISSTLISVDKIKELEGIIPTVEQIQENLIACKIRQAKFGEDYKPLIVKVPEDKWEALEREIKFKKPGHIFVKKGFDIISDSNLGLPLVTIVKI